VVLHDPQIKTIQAIGAAVAFYFIGIMITGILKFVFFKALACSSLCTAKDK